MRALAHLGERVERDKYPKKSVNILAFVYDGFIIFKIFLIEIPFFGLDIMCLK